MWDLRSLYEQPPPDLMEPEAFFSAFARFHDINGHRVECILAKSADKSVNVFNTEGLHSSGSVLIVRDSELQGLETGGAIRVDGKHCLILKVTHPIRGLTRAELEGFSG